MDQKELEALCAEWQERLRLRDWDIRVRFVDTEFLAIRGGALGLCQVNAPRKCAIIHILDPREPNGDHPQSRDVEADLVHELGHVSTWFVSPDDWSSPIGAMLEQFIEQNSLSLLKLKRSLAEALEGTRRRNKKAR